MRKYDVLANELGLIYKHKVKIIPVVMTWEEVVTKYHSMHMKRLGIPKNIEAHIQARVLKATLETISFDHRRGYEERSGPEETAENLVEKLELTEKAVESPTISGK